MRGPYVFLFSFRSILLDHLVGIVFEWLKSRQVGYIARLTQE